MGVQPLIKLCWLSGFKSDHIIIFITILYILQCVILRKYNGASLPL